MAWGGNTILQSVNNLGSASPYADRVGFFDFPAPYGGGDPIVSTAPDQLFGRLSETYYVDIQGNLGAQRTEGFDLSARYNLDLHNAGTLELGVNAVVFTLYDFKTNPTSSYYNLLNLNGTEFFGVIPDYKLTFRFSRL